MRWNLKAILVYTSPMVKDVERFFSILICISPFEGHSFNPLVIYWLMGFSVCVFVVFFFLNIDFSY